MAADEDCGAAVALFRLQEGGWMAREWRELQGVDWL